MGLRCLRGSRSAICLAASAAGHKDDGTAAIERILEVIKIASRIIDLGAEGGGEIVAAGTPEDVVREKRSYTRQYLKHVLRRVKREAAE